MTAGSFEVNRRGRRMVEEQLLTHGITDERVLAAMAELRREEFVPANVRSLAYADHPLAIGGGQTISQPLVVASMTQAVAPTPTDAALEIGSGCGYQAALLGRLCARVVGVELNPELAAAGAATLARLGIDNAQIEAGDGRLGWPRGAPYEVIVVSAAAEAVPHPLLNQLADGGRLVIPLETGRADVQDLVLVTRSGSSLHSRTLFPVRFVPLLEPGRP